MDTTVKDTKYTVTPLTEGSLYVFRVAAENAVGQSDYCEIEDSVLAKDTFSKFSGFILKILCNKLFPVSKPPVYLTWILFILATPGAPYALTPVEVTKRHVDLKWEPPKNDGGRPIQR